MTNTDKLLEIKNLSVVFPSKNGVVHAVNSISYDVYRGEVMGIVGESGSGKSITMRSTPGAMPACGGAP